MSESCINEIADTPYCYGQLQEQDIGNIARRVADLRATGALTHEVLGRIRKYFRIKSIYHSNAIEGNQLDLGETQLVVQQGLTITGKPLKDQAEARNLSDAISYLEDLAGNPEKPITETDVRQIHQLVLKTIDDENAGVYRTVAVEISGSEFKPPAPESVSPNMKQFGEWLAEASVPVAGVGSIEGLINAAVAHSWFVYIHPFVDGNGRVARLLMNLILMRYGYPIAIITKEDRMRYYDALEESQSSDLSSFIALLMECLHESLEEYEEAAKEQAERVEWASALAERLGAREHRRFSNEYEVWKAAMDLLKSYFRQTAEMIDNAILVGNAYFKEFGVLEFEKYMSLRQGDSAKRTWFFRIDFRSGDAAARYLFFFNFPSYVLKSECSDVTLRVAREHPPGSYNYQRLDELDTTTIPTVLEIGYLPKEEKYIVRVDLQRSRKEKLERMGQRFFEEIVRLHFPE
jgi:Fic family protein